jgi:hypothetical protein
MGWGATGITPKYEFLVVRIRKIGYPFRGWPFSQNVMGGVP